MHFGTRFKVIGTKKILDGFLVRKILVRIRAAVPLVPSRCFGSNNVADIILFADRDEENSLRQKKDIEDSATLVVAVLALVPRDWWGIGIDLQAAVPIVCPSPDKFIGELCGL
jgi:hypothetical protein